MGYLDGFVCQWWWLLSLFICSSTLTKIRFINKNLFSYRYADVIVLFRLISTYLVVHQAPKHCSMVFYNYNARLNDMIHYKNGIENKANQPNTHRYYISLIFPFLFRHFSLLLYFPYQLCFLSFSYFEERV
jgi:hypothetical protein